MADFTLEPSSVESKAEIMRRYKREYARAWRKANPDKVRASKRRAYARNPAKHIASVRRWRDKYPEKVIALRKRRKPDDRWATLKKKHKITREQWEYLFKSQGECCAACGSKDPVSAHGWQTDHCHKTGRIRGILCRGCNIAAGAARESAEVLRLLASYVERDPPELCEVQTHGKDQAAFFRGKIIAEGRLD